MEHLETRGPIVDRFGTTWPAGGRRRTTGSRLGTGLAVTHTLSTPTKPRLTWDDHVSSPVSTPPMTMTGFSP
jgi:hypothetical protein